MENNKKEKTSEEKVTLDFLLFLIKMKILYNLSALTTDPLMYLFKNFEEISKFLFSKADSYDIINYLYFAKAKIHDILYNEEELINIEFNDTKKELAYNFYLNLLIKEDDTINNYSYSFEYIKKLNDIRKNLSEKYKSIFYAKCILDLINIYKGLEIFDKENKEEELNKIQEDNSIVIKDNINIFSNNNIKLKINENVFKLKKIDAIFSDIINSLINDKSENFDFMFNIINQLELESINITQTIFETIRKILNKENNNNINKYRIEKKEDLLVERNINFYYILLKYILKNSIYIYQIPFLLDTRKLILKILKTDCLSYDNISNSNEEKLKFLLKAMADSEYYFENKNIIKLKEILNCYKEYYFESKKEDILIIEDIIYKHKKGYEKYLSEYDKEKKMNIRLPITKYISDSKKYEPKK